LIGTIIDKYEVLQKVGEGGMATVYRGRHTTLDREVAVKILHPHLSSSTRNRKRFAREARAIEQLRHDNILEIFDYSGPDAEECYIVTEFVGGHTLSELMDRVGRLPSEATAIVGIRLAEALHYAHRCSVLHRDLKPDNVMIRADGRIKLMDFGIARFLDETQVTMTGALVGSPAFMSPEQAKEGVLDARSDLFSLGTLLFYLASGHFPFSGSNPSLILKNIIEGNRPQLADLVPGLSSTLVDCVEQLLQSEPDDRYTTAMDVADVLRQALTEVGLTDHSPSWCLPVFLEDPQTYRERLHVYLMAALLPIGKQCLDDGEHLVALRLFNRLLALDEDNEEVLALVRGLHSEPKRRRPFELLGALVVILSLVAGGSVWYFNDAYESVQANVNDEPTDQMAAVAPALPIRSPDEPSLLNAPDDSSTTVAVPVTPPATIRPLPLPTSTNPTAKAPRDRPPKASLPDGPARPPIVDKNPTQPDRQIGYLEVRLREGGVGYIHIDNINTNKTTFSIDPIEVGVGKHEVMIRSERIVDMIIKDVYIAPSETVTLLPKVEFKPITVTFTERYDQTCKVTLNQTHKGDLASLNYQLTVKIDKESSSSMVFLNCGDQTSTLAINSKTPVTPVGDARLETAFPDPKPHTP